MATILAGFTLLFLHWLMAFLAIRWHVIGTLVKGNYQALVKDGEVLWKNMKRNNISEEELLEAIRMHSNGAGVDEVEAACYERSGDISIQLKES